MSEFHNCTAFAGVTPEEFLADLAEKNGETVEQLQAHLASCNEVVVPCNCGDAICRGWIITNSNDRDWIGVESNCIETIRPSGPGFDVGHWELVESDDSVAPDVVVVGA